MVDQARARNAGDRVDLRRGSAEDLPYDRNTFDAAPAINSFQVWQNAVAGLREIHRVMKPGGRVELGFTPYSGQSKKGLMENACDCRLHERANSRRRPWILRARFKARFSQRPVTHLEIRPDHDARDETAAVAVVGAASWYYLHASTRFHRTRVPVEQPSTASTESLIDDSITRRHAKG
jgi:SAM-dependent methyltransferase